MHSGTDFPAVARALARYLRLHPNASDMADGIRRWWLPDPDAVTEHELEEALIWMQAQGLIAGALGADGRVRYQRTGSDVQLDQIIPSARHG